MPQNKFALARYRLIDETLRKRTYAKTAEIVELCKKQLGMKVTSRTIQMDMEAMRNDPFLGCFLPISYCNRRKAYYYAENTAGYFLSFYLTEQELRTLQRLQSVLHDKIAEKDFNSYCSFLDKIIMYYKM